MVEGLNKAVDMRILVLMGSGAMGKEKDATLRLTCLGFAV